MPLLFYKGQLRKWIEVMSIIDSTTIQESSPPSLWDELGIYIPSSVVEDFVSNNNPLRERLIYWLERVAMLHGSFFISNDEEASDSNVRAALKCYRGIIILKQDGKVNSSEHLRFDDPDVFFNSPKDQAFKYLSSIAQFDDFATLFTKANMNLALSQRKTYLSGKEDVPETGVEAEIRFLEYFINKDIRDGVVEVDDNGIFQESVSEDNENVVEIYRLRTFQKKFTDALIIALRENRKHEHELAVNNFLSYLSRDVILPTMEDAGLNGCRWYNWLVGQSRQGGVDHEVGKRRYEAISAFPLIHCVASNFNNPVSTAIEEGNGLIDALSTYFEKEKSHVKLLRGITVDSISLPSAPEESRLLSILDDISYLIGLTPPQNGDQWEAYFALLRASSSLRNTTSDDDVMDKAIKDDIAIKGDIASFSGKWDTLDLDACYFAQAAFSDMVQDIYDTVFLQYHRFYTNGIGMPSVESLRKVVIGNRRIFDIIEVAQKWRNENNLIKARMSASFPLGKGQFSKKEWPQLHDYPAMMSNGVYVHSLNTKNMLTREAKNMEHCLDTYVGKCLYSGSHIVSLREKDNTILSTAELQHDWVVDKDNKGITDTPMFAVLPPGVVQHSGLGNREPPIRAQEALWEYMNKLATGAIEIEKDDLHEQKVIRADYASKYGENHRTIVEYNPRIPQAMEQVWKEYKEFFPKKVKRKNIEGAFAEMVNASK